jgi:hypothetical protein
MHPRPRRARLTAAFLSATLCAACDDLPSGPQVWTREAAGRQWVALSEPVGLPAARTWLTWTTPAAADSVRGLLAAAVRERRAGRIEVGLAEEQAAAELAAASLARSPDAPGVLLPLAAVESWAERAADPSASGRFPELARDRGAVLQMSAAARGALAAGDTAAACVALTRAAGIARRWTPMSVAVAAVVQAELAIAADPHPSPDLLRARQLLRGARMGVAAGDHARALQRALYALQLIEHARRR